MKVLEVFCGETDIRAYCCYPRVAPTSQTRDVLSSRNDIWSSSTDAPAVLAAGVPKRTEVVARPSRKAPARESRLRVRILRRWSQEFVLPSVRNTVFETARHVDVIHRTDVLVVGSGPGGLAAAIAAARAGVEVALVERFGCFGGNITAVGVEGFAWYRHEQTVEAGGIGREFEDRAKAMGAAIPESQSLSYELDSKVSTRRRSTRS